MCSLILPQSQIMPTHTADNEQVSPDSLVSAHTLKELRDMCKNQGLRATGGKRDLASRLCAPASDDSEVSDDPDTITLSG